MKHRDLLEKKVEERTRELETANHKITNIVESISDGFLALDKEWRYIYLNHNPYLHEGRTAQDLIGENIWTYFSRGCRDVLVSAIPPSDGGKNHGHL